MKKHRVKLFVLATLVAFSGFAAFAGSAVAKPVGFLDGEYSYAKGYCAKFSYTWFADYNDEKISAYMYDSSGKVVWSDKDINLYPRLSNGNGTETIYWWGAKTAKPGKYKLVVYRYFYSYYSWNKTAYPETLTFYLVKAKTLKSSMVTMSTATRSYTGKAITPKVTVEDKGTVGKRTKGTDYTVKYSNNIYAGTATVKITGKGHYKGTVTKTFKIKYKLPSRITLSSSSYSYNGSKKTPTVTVKTSSGKKLIKGTDYTVTYSNNTKAGTATVKITGKGKYQGTATKTFEIV